jgi:hypothetical protein
MNRVDEYSCVGGRFGSAAVTLAAAHDRPMTFQIDFGYFTVAGVSAMCTAGFFSFVLLHPLKRC